MFVFFVIYADAWMFLASGGRVVFLLRGISQPQACGIWWSRESYFLCIWSLDWVYCSRWWSTKTYVNKLSIDVPSTLWHCKLVKDLETHVISHFAKWSQQKSMFSHLVWLTLRLDFWISSISGKLHLGEWAIVRHPRGPRQICRPWRERILA